MDGLVGRDQELADVDGFLDRLAGGPAALVLEGPAGIGKSAIWSAATERAQARGIRVLAARPSGAEASYAYQALGDLLGPILDGGVATLSAPQRHALDVALLRAAPAPGDQADAQIISVATTNAMLAMARDAAVLVAIDDAPWLDPASAAVLTFAARRLGDRGVGVLVTQRASEPGPAPLELDRAVSMTERRWLGPLSYGALHALLAGRLGLTLPRPTLARLHEMAQGNPFHALEMGRALQRLPTLPRPGDPFPIPESIRDLIRGRLEPLSPGARHLLLLAAAAGSPTADELNRAIGEDAQADAGFAEALDAGLISIDDGRVWFSHPLIASTVTAAATATERRAAHQAFAAAVSEPEARGRHLALATTRPDAGVADALEAAAIDARRRAATDAAVELYRLALDRTPAPAAMDRDRRRVRLADVLFDQSDLPASREVVRRAIADLPHGPLRAEALMIEGTIGWYLDTADFAQRMLEEALPDAVGDPELLGRIHYRLAVFVEDAVRSVDHARTAAELLAATTAATTRAGAMFSQFLGEVYAGEPPNLALFEEALAIEPAGPHTDKSTIPAIWWTAIDRTDLARTRIHQMLEESRLAGEVSGEADLLTRLAEVELLADEWPRAREAADEARMLAQQEGQEAADPARRARALVDAHEGRLDAAEEIGLAALERAELAGETWLAVAYLHLVALVASWRGDYAAVEKFAERSAEHLVAVRTREPLRMDIAPERVEALVALGRLDEAEAHLADLEARGAVVPRPNVDAAVARGRALLLAARGDLGAAVATTDPVADQRSDAWRRFDRARTLLVRGQVLRQARRPREAGAALDEANTVFEQLGATLFAARVRAEIDRLGRRRVGSDELTPTERRVAELAASGLRNHEVADALSISPKTVEAHLARIYAKLGIRSRAELGRAMADRPDVGNRPM